MLRGLAALLNRLPYRCALFVAWMLAWVAFHVVRFRRAEAQRRIREVFGAELPATRVRRIAWVSLRNLAFNVVEMMRAPRIDLAWIERHIPGFGEHVVVAQENIARYGGAVIAVPHMGNWDLAGWACHRHGVQMFSIAGKQKNPLVNAWINRQRESGMAVLERGSGTLKQIVKRLRQGSALAILPDVRLPTADLKMPFLGKEANLGRGMALFAITARVPVIVAILRRQGWSRHEVTYFPPILPDPQLPRDEEVVRITGAVMKLVDQAIRHDPEQWFWYNKRWVLKPVREKQ